MSKQYTSLQSFAEGTFHRLQPLLQHPPLKLEVVNVMGGGEHEWASVEMKAKNTMKNGESLFTSSNVCLVPLAL